MWWVVSDACPMTLALSLPTGLSPSPSMHHAYFLSYINKNPQLHMGLSSWANSMIVALASAEVGTCPPQPSGIRLMDVKSLPPSLPSLHKYVLDMRVD